MEHLWAPWRNSYVTADKKTSATVFYDIGQSSNDAENFVICRSKTVYVVLNRFPYNTAHSLVIPYRMVADLSDLTEPEGADLWDLVRRTVASIRSVYNPHGFNIGINLGESAGAGLPDHLHVHVVPRWKGDTNFMATTAETRIHPSDLPSVYQHLKAAFEKN
ncbi:MAG: HIT domain-containing protein [Methylacidiphilales bacterium]|nr:HIT domain-containing protein [Candidatus Methylacidiphilales bacterium]